ncbi:YbdD/YjiX family protein [Nocardioides sp. Leaf374]|uniref:YbdD/YjiX family protein n=1 Tax=Nocardioides sp. Leaf374 TaxID=2876560 RepID=UPI001E36BE59|nr:YbdD/YjiX family protein [Nocardioides sp. Leaf374]
MSATGRPTADQRPGAVRRALAGVRWYARELSGEGRWDAYLARCEREGTEPMSRRAFERHRDDHRESSTQGRCC